MRTIRNLLRPALTAMTAAMVMAPSIGSANDFCPDVYHVAKFGPLNFRPAFLHMEQFEHPNGQSYDGLVFSSFFNSVKTPDGTTTVGFFERDLVARIRGIGFRYPAWFDVDRDVEVLTDLTNPNPQLPTGPGQQVWPNDVTKVPDGAVPFEALISPQGFHPAELQGRISLINLDDPNKQEYIIDQSVQNYGDPDNGINPPPCLPESNPGFDPTQKPRFYHDARWFDMDGDGLLDPITVRSGFRVRGTICFFAPGEVVWFKNPGAVLDPNVGWEEFVIAGYPSLEQESSADISLDIADLEGDGIPEIVANRFFGPPLTPGETIDIYGAPVGQAWSDVDPATNPARKHTISSGQGRPFGVTFVDLNRDGKMDVLATNHQSDGCFPSTQDVIPGRIYAMEQPASGDIFNDPWVTHILKDDIRPQPTFPNPTSGPGRLAPGAALEFYVSAFHEAVARPWVVAGGDEAAKVWLLKPQSEDPNDWNYDSAVIFDINDYYGENTTQSLTAPAPDVGNSISTIGKVAWRYDRGWAWDSYSEIYIPVFEGRDIHRITFRPDGAGAPIVCPTDDTYACPAP